MKRQRSPWRLPAGFALAAFAFLFATPSRTQDRTPPELPGPPAVRAEGTFEVQLQPSEGDEEWGQFTRLTLDKTFSGDLQAASKGVMLAARTEVEGSAGYVALERVRGELEGRKGSFILQHSGIMGRGKESLEVQVVTDSGTGELKGLSGSMEIEIDESGHRYVFLYSLPEKEDR